jgi:predicted RNase H-like nuclease (RuvC/YqgF family)
MNMPNNDDPQKPKTDDAPSDYAALLRKIRDTENLVLEITQLRMKISASEAKIAQMEPYVQSLEQAIAERDQQLDELRSVSGARALMATVKKKDETIARLQQALQTKHREVEELRARR